MRKLLLTGAALLALGCAAAQASPYDQPGPGWQSPAALQSQLQSQGWQRIDKIEAEKGQYEVKGVDPQGRYVEAKYDPYSLQQTKVEVKGGTDSGKPKSKDRGFGDFDGKGSGKGGKGGKGR